MMIIMKIVTIVCGLNTYIYINKYRYTNLGRYRVASLCFHGVFLRVCLVTKKDSAVLCFCLFVFSPWPPGVWVDDVLGAVLAIHVRISALCCKHGFGYTLLVLGSACVWSSASGYGSVGLNSRPPKKVVMQGLGPRGILAIEVEGRFNVNPGLIDHWFIDRGVSPFSGDSSLLEGTPSL